MKTRLNLTIDELILSKVKAYAASKHTSVSELVEQYFKTIAKTPKKNNIIEMVEKLNPLIQMEGDLKDQYYKEQATKHGF
jgi:hypothetical protein